MAVRTVRGAGRGGCEHAKERPWRRRSPGQGKVSPACRRPRSSRAFRTRGFNVEPGGAGDAAASSGAWAASRRRDLRSTSRAVPCASAKKKSIPLAEAPAANRVAMAWRRSMIWSFQCIPTAEAVDDHPGHITDDYDGTDFPRECGAADHVDHGVHGDQEGDET